MSSSHYEPMLSGQTHFVHGADYNPEQWFDRPDILEEDFQLLPKAGMNSWSVGIFSWAALEPREGHFEFEWMTRILDRMAKEGNTIILATPSGSRPAWMTQKYPDTARVKSWKGPREPHRGRHNHCPTSPDYRQAVVRINRELAKRFGKHPAVKLWHLSNEYNGECRCDRCLAAFRVWLQKKYRTLEAINAAYWNAFWGHLYTDWEQIHPFENFHDGLKLDWARFCTDQTVDFMCMEKEALREFSDLPVTTNMMGHFPTNDYWKFAPHLDVLSNDCYPSFNGREDETETFTGAALDGDLMRSLGGGKPWLLMESTPSQLNWSPYFVMKRPGVHRREMLLQIGAGADGTCYFQWRKGRGGSEKYHGAVVDHAGHENRVFAEISAYGKELENLRPILGSRVEAPIGLIEDWPQRWGLESAQGPRKIDPSKGYMEEVKAWYQAIVTRATSVDPIGSHLDFSSYRLLLLPMVYQITEDMGKRLTDYVENGGVILLSYLSGHCDELNRCHLGGWPGAGMNRLSGVQVEEMDGLPDEINVPVESTGKSSEIPPAGNARIFCERLKVQPDVEIMATYTGEFYAGEPVLTRRLVGRGAVYYLGARMDKKFLGGLMDAIVAAHDIPCLLPRRPEQGLWIQQRVNATERFLFVHNTTPTEKTVDLPTGTWTNLSTGEAVNSKCQLPGVGSLVLTAPREQAGLEK